MSSRIPVRRALMLAAAVGMSACDVAEFVMDPKPIFEQTWNLPAPSTNVSVASLLPADNSVSILPDSSAFALSLSAASATSQSLGSYCSQCAAQHGTTSIKPFFEFTFSSSTALPSDVVSAAVSGGTVAVQMSNALSFDPIRVKTGSGEQGYLAIILTTMGGQVLARDTVKGATATWAPGATLTRNIPLATGNIGGFVAVQLHLYSPVGDTPVAMNASGTVSTAMSVPSLHVGSVSLNVPNRALTSEPETIDLTGLEDFSDQVVSGALEMTISNPFAVSGTIGMRLAYDIGPNDAITKSISVAPGTLAPQKIRLDSAEMALLMGREVTITVTGAVSSTGPVTVTPRQAISIDNRIILKIRTGGGN